MEKVTVPVWEKYMLSIEEAAEYFGVGAKKLRERVEEDADKKFIVVDEGRARIKRRLFEAYVDSLSAV